MMSERSRRSRWAAGIVAGLVLIAGCGESAKPGATGGQGTAVTTRSEAGDGSGIVWHGDMSAAQVERFEQLVQEELSRQGFEPRIRAGVAHVEQDDRHLQFGLVNLAQRCALAPEADWPALIRGHFESLAQAAAEGEVVERMLEDFEQAQPLLTARLWPLARVELAGGEALIWREDLPGIATVLTIDTPAAMIPLQQAALERWQKQSNELFDIAARNLRVNFPVALEPVDENAEIKVLMGEGNEHYTASNVLALGKYPQAVGRYGAVIAAPTSSILICHPLEQDDLGVTAVLLQPMVAQVYEDGPNSISPRLYWFHEGRFETIEVKRSEEGVEVAAPKGYLELVAGSSETSP